MIFPPFFQCLSMSSSISLSLCQPWRWYPPRSLEMAPAGLDSLPITASPDSVAMRIILLCGHGSSLISKVGRGARNWKNSVGWAEKQDEEMGYVQFFFLLLLLLVLVLVLVLLLLLLLLLVVLVLVLVLLLLLLLLVLVLVLLLVLVLVLLLLLLLFFL